MNTEHLTDLSTSSVTRSHFTLGNAKSFFNIIIHMLQIIYVSWEENNSSCCCAASAVYLLLVSASYYLHSPSTASGAHYRRRACIDMDMLRHGLNFSTAWCTMRLISVKKRLEACINAEGGHSVTLNTCCDIACLTFQLPHITTGSFQSHRRQTTTGSLQSLQRLKERNKPSVRWNSFTIHKLVWWYFQVGLASG